MGRYAFFSSGLEYKFYFGVQPSSDIRSFGGRFLYEKSTNGYLHHEWDQKDREYIELQLKELKEWLPDAEIDFTTYDKNLQGTHKLAYDLYELYKKDTTAELIARYILGCLIYHQLLCTDTLTVDYEG